MSLVQRGFKRSVLLCVLAFAVFGGTAQAQDYSSMGINDVYDYAKKYLQLLEYQKAVVPLKEVISRMSPRTDDQSRKTTQDCRLELARVYYMLGQNEEGVALVNEYLDNKPCEKEATALRLLAQSCFDNKDWDKIISLADRLTRATGLNPEDEFNMKLLLGQAYYNKASNAPELWAKCIEPLVFCEQNSTDERIKGVCQIMVARALVEGKDWGRLFSWVRRLENTDLRYDITLNLTYMQGANGLYTAGGKDNLLNALYLYRMVLPRDELIAFADARKAELESQINGAELQAFEKQDLQRELAGITNGVATLTSDDFPPYEDDVTLHVGEIYGHKDIKRYWEAFVTFNRLNQESDEEVYSESAGYFAAKTLYDVGEVERAEKRIVDYIKEDKNRAEEGMYTRELLMLMLNYNLQQGNFEKVAAMREYIMGLEPNEDATKRNAKANLHYMLGLTYLQMYQQDAACEQLDTIVDGMRDENGQLLEEYSNSYNFSFALYYRGMAYLMQGKYAEALSDFEEYLRNYPEGDFCQDAVFRKGVCLYGLEQIADAEKEFTYFIDHFKDNSYLADVYSMRGDILVAKEPVKGKPHPLDQAQEDYAAAIRVAKYASQARYPATRSAEAYKLESKWDEIISIMETYKLRWGGEADIAEAQYWIGQANIRKGLFDKAFECYLDAIEEYGDSPDQMGVDKIITEIVKLYNQQKDAMTRNTWFQRVTIRLESAQEKDQAVLVLRWRVVRALLSGDENVESLSNMLMETTKDLSVTSPSVLYLMCDAAVDAGDMEKMKAYANYFIKNFDESELIGHAYRARVTVQMANEQYEKVLESVETVQGKFGAAPDLGWSQIAKANALDQLGRSEEAGEAFKMISSVPQWRNQYMGEAYFGQGRSLFNQGMYEKADAQYRKTYMMCKAFDNGVWAAQAYLGSADCLEKLDKKADAKTRLQEMLADKYLNTEEHAEFVREFVKQAEQRLGK